MKAPNKQHIVRTLHARCRVIYAAIRRLRAPLFCFVAVTVVGTLVLWKSDRRYRSLARTHIYVLDLATFQSSPGDMPDKPWTQAVAFVIMTGGILSVAGGAARLVQLISDPKEQQLALAATFHHHVIVCGIGHVGFGVITQLLEFGESVVAVDTTEHGDWGETLRKAGVPVIIGDARQRKTLLDAGIERASAMVACTSDDLTNLDMALDAREVNPEVKVIMRMFDASLARKVSKGFGIHCALSVPALAAPAFAAAATGAGIAYSFKLDGLVLNIANVAFGDGCRFLGQTVEQVERAVDCTFVGREVEGNLSLHPDHSHVLCSGDRFTILGSLEALKKVDP